MAIAFDVSRAEGIRAVIFFLLPTAWARSRSPPSTASRGSSRRWASGIPAGGVVAGLVISSVLLFDAPVSVANLALGTMEAFFFMMALADAPETRQPSIPRGQHIWPLSLLLMLTTISISVAVTV